MRLVDSFPDGIQEGDDGRAPLVHVAVREAEGRADEGHLRALAGEFAEVAYHLVHHGEPSLPEGRGAPLEAEPVPSGLPDGDPVPEEHQGDALALDGVRDDEGAPARLRVGVHGDPDEIEEAVGRDEADGLVPGEAPREVVKDVIVSFGEDAGQVAEDLLRPVCPAGTRGDAEDVVGLHGRRHAPQPGGEGRARVLQDGELRAPELHEVVRGVVEIQDADPLPPGIGQVGGEQRRDRRLADPALFVVYRDAYHQMKE